MTRSIETKLGKLSYLTYGEGEKTFILFHGFGQTQEDMAKFLELRKNGSKYILVDIFYHGRSHWFDSATPLTKNTWKIFIEQLMKKEGFHEFHLIGYSMGGKFALLTYELFDKNVKSLTLLAPDGIKTGLWYSISSYPGSFHGVFKGVVFKPKLFFGFMNGLNSAGLLESSIVKFVQTQMETRSKRAQVYFTWKVFGGIQLHLGKIIRQLRKNKTPVDLFIGKYDRMVTEQNLARFSSKVPHLRQHSLPVGHGRLIAATVDFLKKTKN